MARPYITVPLSKREVQTIIDSLEISYFGKQSSDNPLFKIFQSKFKTIILRQIKKEIK